MMIPNPREKNIYMSKYFSYFGRKYENFLQKVVDDSHQMIDKARKDAGANPLPADIRRLEDDTRRIEGLLSKQSVPDLGELRTKIQELHKTVDGL